MVSVVLHTFLKDYYPEENGVLKIPYQEGLTVELLLGRLKFKAGVVGLILVNGRVASTSTALTAGDTVELFPIFGGG